MADEVDINRLAQAVMTELEDYRDLAAEDLKKAIKRAGDTVKQQIKEKAPKLTGEYSKSWKVRKQYETSGSIGLIVYSPTKYSLAHLLEHGHAKRGGGRTRAFPHIAPAEEIGEEQLLRDIEKALGG